LDSAAAASLSLNHVINVQAGLNCTLMYLPAHSGANGGWIIVRSANFASLPAAGTRVALADAANMPVLTYGTKANPIWGGDERRSRPPRRGIWIEGLTWRRIPLAPAGKKTPPHPHSYGTVSTNTKTSSSHIITGPD
jgi:hypothetical protein